MTPDYGGLTYVAPTIRSSGVNFATLLSDGLGGLLEAVIAANSVAIAAPGSAPTAGSPTGTDGSLPAGAYYARFSYSNGYGETTPSPETTAITVGATQHIPFTFPSLPTGASSINLYLTQAGGAAGSETLYAAGITATTYNATKATWAGTATPPASDTTAITGRTLHKARSVEQRQGWIVWDLASQTLANYLRGQSLGFDDARAIMLQMEAVCRIWAQTLAEANALIAANPGQVVTITNGIGNPATKRIFS